MWLDIDWATSWVGWGLLLWLVCSSTGTWSGDALARKLNTQERYEQTMVEWGLQQAKLKRDRFPQGKVIERVVIIRANVIAPFDPWPKIINIIHVKTHESIIRQELLIKEGQKWKQRLVSESERNLRRLTILTTARTVACLSSDPNKVILLVVTKDLWSLRFSTSFTFSGAVANVLGFYPMEVNLAGFGKQLGVYLSFSQFDFSTFGVRDRAVVGQFYNDPRLFGSRIQLYEELALYLNGSVPCGGAIGGQSDVWCPAQPEAAPIGVYARLDLSRSLFSLATRWAFGFSAVFQMRQNRSFRQNDPAQDIPPGERPGLSLRTVLFEHSDGQLRAVPFAYDSRSFVSSAGVTYSLGYRVKHDFSASTGVSWYSFAPPENFPFDDEIRRQFVSLSLPRSESYAFVQFRYGMRTTRFTRVRNIRLFALSEDVGLGPSVSLSVRPTADLQYDTQQYIVLAGSASYTWNLGGNFLSLGISGGTRWQPRSNEIGIPGPWLNNYFQANITHVSPILWIGRFVAQSYVYLRHNNIDNAFSGLGNNAGVRGYPDGVFAGQNKFQANVEFRTLPLNFWTLHVGLVAFYDGAALWGGRDPNQPSQALPLLYRHSVGVGIRTLFPQFSKSVMRIDMGIPLMPEGAPPQTWFSITFGQFF